MYKITLYDENCSPICDGVTTFFTDDINTFEENWFLCAEKEQMEWYKRSKAGDLVTDYYGYDSKLNIFQEDKAAEIIFQRKCNIYKKQDFKEDRIETYCFVTVGKFSKEELLNVRPNLEAPEMLIRLFRDIPGEAG